MGMRKDCVKYVAIIGVVMLAGCRFKGIESFETATTPVKIGKASGDKYGNGGIAYASAGSKVETQYGTGADENSTAKVDPKMDRPAKGSGQQAGELGGDAEAGYGKSNSPANQPKPNIDSSNSH